MNQKTKLGLRLAKQRGSSNSGAQLSIQQGRGGQIENISPPSQTFLGGKYVYYTQPWKN